MAQKGFNNLDPEQRERIDQAIAASGLTDKEWIDLVAKTYLLQEIGTNPEHQKNIATLRGATNMIVDLFSTMIQQSGFHLETIQRTHEEEMQEKRLMIQQMDGELREAERAAKAKDEEMGRLKERTEAAEARAEAAAQSDQKNNVIIEQLQRQNGELGGLVTEYKADHDRAERLEKELAAAQRNAEEAERRAAEAERQLAAANEANRKEIEQLQARHAEDIERERERKDVEREREVLAVRSDFTKQIGEIQSEHAKTVKDLYDRLEAARNEKGKNGGAKS